MLATAGQAKQAGNQVTGQSAASSTPGSPKLYGNLDLASADRVEGWIVAHDNPAKRRRVRILFDEREVAEVVAGDFRRDLKTPQIGVGDGCYAFFYRPPSLEPGEHVVQVVDADTSYELNESPQTVWVPAPTSENGRPPANAHSGCVWAAELELVRGGLDAFPAAAAMFEGQSVSLGILNGNPYYVTVFALTNLTPSPDLPVDVSIGGQEVTSSPAVMQAGVSSGRFACLYRFYVPSSVLLAAGMPVELSLAGRPLTVPGTPPEISCRFIGALDRCDTRSVSGWAACLDALDQRVSVDILIDGRFSDSVTVGGYRPELHSLGYGGGNHGFSLEFSEPVATSADSDVHVRALVRGLGYELRYSPWYIARAAGGPEAGKLLARAELPN